MDQSTLSPGGALSAESCRPWWSAAWGSRVHTSTCTWMHSQAPVLTGGVNDEKEMSANFMMIDDTKIIAAEQNTYRSDEKH